MKAGNWAWMPGVEHVIFASREELAAAREVAS